MIRVNPTSIEELFGQRMRMEEGGGTSVYRFDLLYKLLAPAISKDDTRSSIFGVGLRVFTNEEGSQVLAAATDGHRIHRVTGKNQGFTETFAKDHGEDLDVFLVPEAAAVMAAGEYAHVIASQRFVCVTNAREGSTIHNRPTSDQRSTGTVLASPPMGHIFDPCDKYGARLDFTREHLLSVLRGKSTSDGVALELVGQVPGKEALGPALVIEANGARVNASYLIDAVRVLPKGTTIELRAAVREPGPRTSRWGSEAELQPLYLRALAKFEARTYLYEAAIMPRRN